jgi:hypothetical protein
MTQVSIIWRFFALLIPLVAVYLTWVKCPLQRENTPVYKALVTPDVVAPLIFLFGIASCRALQTSALHLVYDYFILLLICSWIVVYSRSCSGPHTEHTMKVSLLILTLSLLLCSLVIVTTNDVIHRMCLVPVAIWIILLLLHQTQRNDIQAADSSSLLTPCTPFSL